MTLPASGPISLGAVNGEFGFGSDFASYYGVYHGIGSSAARFVTAGNPFLMSFFYSTFKITGGSASPGTGFWTVPVYNTISATVQGGTGGQAGFWGYNFCSNVPTGSSNGTNGSTSSFGGYVAAGGGAGGSGNGAGGAPGAVASGSWTNPVQGGNGPTSGTQIYITVGGGGSGGGGGSNCFFFGPNCFCTSNAASGSGGSAGFVSISWS